MGTFITAAVLAAAAGLAVRSMVRQKKGNRYSAAATVADAKDAIESAVQVPVKIYRHCGRNRPADRPRTPDADDTKHTRKRHRQAQRGEANQ